jgi:hypothetical protein
MAYGQIPLSHVLATMLSANLIPNIDSTVVVPLLQKNLEWRVRDLCGNVVPTEKLVGKAGSELEVQIAKRDVDVLKPGDPRDKFPCFGDWQVYKDVTKGKTGGCSD